MFLQEKLVLLVMSEAEMDICKNENISFNDVIAQKRLVVAHDNNLSSISALVTINEEEVDELIHETQSILKAFHETINQTETDVIDDSLDQIAKLEKENAAVKAELEMMKIMVAELDETNNALVLATWRERDTKKKLDQATQQIIESQSKRIEESIKYAQRIQNSLLRNEPFLRQLFPDSFILFKPKDIVSGDFPFIFSHENSVYIAVADCTGHGVPGALMSIIGALILNEIVTYEESVTAAELLDRLHAQIVKTLRQDQEDCENERDGMDIGMCKINLETGELEYAGAHRPLYILRENEMLEIEEVKGNKYPIGGVQYRGREAFLNNLSKLNKGDKIYFFSDGLTDQFGGDGEEPKKFGAKRVKEIIINSKEVAMNDQSSIFESKFMEWQGEESQLDDVLLIGIQF